MPIMSYSTKAPRRGERRLVGEVVVARVHVAEHGLAEIGALGLDDVEHVVAEPEPARQVHHQRQAGPRLRPGSAVQRLALVGGEVRGDADLADQADAGRRRRHRAPRRRSGRRWRRPRASRPRAGARSGGSSRRPSRCGGRSPRRCGAARPGCGRCRGRSGRRRCVRPRAAKRPSSVDGVSFVVSAMLCAVDEGVLAQLPEDRGLERRVGEPGAVGARRVPPAGAVVEDVLVHQGDAEVGRPGSAPVTVMTCPERTCAGESSLMISSAGTSVGQRRSGC